MLPGDFRTGRHDTSDNVSEPFSVGCFNLKHHAAGHANRRPEGANGLVGGLLGCAFILHGRLR